jgi:hypothetical protein
MRFFDRFLACIDASVPECEPLLVLTLMKLLRYLIIILSSDALQANSSQRFLEY